MMVDGQPGPRYCYAAPFHMSGKYNLAAALRSRETLVVRNGFSLSRFWDEIREHGCTYAQLFPQLARMLLAQPATPEDAQTPLSRVICSPAFAEVDEFKARFGVDHVASGYGMHRGRRADLEHGRHGCGLAHVRHRRLEPLRRGGRARR